MLSQTKEKPSLYNIVQRLQGKERCAVIDVDQRTTLISWPQNTVDILTVPELKVAMDTLEAASHPTWLFGFLSYEAGRHFDRMPSSSQHKDVPETLFWMSEGVIVFDKKMQSHVTYGSQRFKHEAETLLSSPIGEQSIPKSNPKKWIKEQEASQYKSHVQRLRKEIALGNVYQANIAWRSQEFEFKNQLETWWNIRKNNPARHGAWFKSADIYAASNSPERFIKLTPLGNEKWIESAPIKGTVRRIEKLEGRIELWRNEKERAELTMIVDLVRNDLGRVCIPGSIQPHMRRIRRCGDLYHAEQVIQGQLRQGLGLYDVLKATFPPGSVTGAPKVAAMNLIAELEQNPRGIYTGAIGFASSHGEAHFNVAIRTIQSVGEKATFHVGAGIVHDSQPTKEWEETLAKGKALADSI